MTGGCGAKAAADRVDSDRQEGVGRQQPIMPDRHNSPKILHGSMEHYGIITMTPLM
jgi:hypothetical protein